MLDGLHTEQGYSLGLTESTRSFKGCSSTDNLHFVTAVFIILLDTA